MQIIKSICRLLFITGLITVNCPESTFGAIRNNAVLNYFQENKGQVVDAETGKPVTGVLYILKMNETTLYFTGSKIFYVSYKLSTSAQVDFTENLSLNQKKGR